MAKNTFGIALEMMKDGERVRRAGWNGKGMFIYLVRGSKIPLNELRGDAAKHISEDRIKKMDQFKTFDPVREIVEVGSHIDMKAADGTVVVGWLASQTDMLANDWELA